MNIKRTLALLLSLFLLLPLLFGVARAAGQEELEQLIIDSCKYGQKVDISDYQLTEKQLEELYYRLQAEGRLPWYASHEYTYYYSELTNLMLEFEPLLLEEDRMVYERELAALVHSCVFAGMEDWEIALAVHDQLVLRSVYDLKLKKNTGYQLLVEGTAVCAGYAAVYQDILQRLGIPCLQVESEEMDHVWNLVQLDGQWYHVDVTWDDPTPDLPGMVDHQYFLKTDEEMKNAEEPHHDWQTHIRCDDTRFSDAFWVGVESPILYTDSDTCFYLREKDCRNSLYRRVGDTETRIYREKESYLDIGHGEYAYYHTGLQLRAGRLWLCSMTEVFSLDLEGKHKQVEYTHSLKALKRHLAGFRATEEELVLSLSDHDGKRLQLTKELSPSGDHLHSFSDTVTEPTCTQPGFTTSLCACGLKAVGNETGPKGHSWQEQDKRGASPFSEGFVDNLCTVCDATERQVLEKLSFTEWAREYLVVIVALVAIPVSIFIGKNSKFKR